MKKLLLLIVAGFLSAGLSAASGDAGATARTAPESGVHHYADKANSKFEGFLGNSTVTAAALTFAAWALYDKYLKNAGSAAFSTVTGLARLDGVLASIQQKMPESFKQNPEVAAAAIALAATYFTNHMGWVHGKLWLTAEGFGLYQLAHHMLTMDISAYVTADASTSTTAN